MQLGLAIAVALLIVAVVAWPLATRRRNAPPPTDPSETPNSDRAALNAVYDAIRALQTDHSLGRVNDDDFREQLDEYRRQAAMLLREMERQTGGERDD